MISGTTYGDAIRSARKKAGLTQKELAEKTGLAEITIRQYENNKREPRNETLQKISIALNIPVSELAPGLFLSKLTSMIDEFKKNGMIEYCEDETGELHEINEEYIISQVKQLNYKGLARIDHHIQDLLKIPEYQKKNNAPEQE